MTSQVQSRAYVSVPVCDLRREPLARSAGLKKDRLQETQLLLGEAVAVLEPGPGWSYVQALEQPFWSPDENWIGYPGWVESRQLSQEAPILPPEPITARWHEHLSWGTKSQQSLSECRHSSFSLEELAAPLLGSRYFWGGRSGEGVDCSGLVQLLWGFRGVQLPRNASHQARACTPIAWADLQPEDLVFSGKVLAGSLKIDHVLLYLGSERFLEATEQSMSVRISRLDQLKHEGGPERVFSAGRVELSPRP